MDAGRERILLIVLTAVCMAILLAGAGAIVLLTWLGRIPLRATLLQLIGLGATFLIIIMALVSRIREIGSGKGES